MAYTINYAHYYVDLIYSVIDPDNDVVRCRWPETKDNECNEVNNGVCGETPKAKLNGVREDAFCLFVN